MQSYIPKPAHSESSRSEEEQERGGSKIRRMLMTTDVLSKKLAGESAADMVESGMTVGLGTGSTVSYTIQRLGERVRQGLSIRAIPTSVETERLARELGIELTSFTEVQSIDIALDGAD